MSKLNLTREELSLVHSLSLGRGDSATRLGFYASVLVPALAFAGYGWIHGDVLAIGIAFAGLVGFLCWRISRELSLAPIYKSLFSKIAENERSGNE
jgi:hypothetical protein